MRYALIALALLCSVLPAQARYRYEIPHSFRGRYYRSVDGSVVHVPYHVHRHMRGELAVCLDGTHSVSHHHHGTCSHHGGVRRWG